MRAVCRRIQSDLLNPLVDNSGVLARAEVRRWEKAGVTMLLVGCSDVAAVRAVAEAVRSTAPGQPPSPTLVHE